MTPASNTKFKNKKVFLNLVFDGIFKKIDELND